MENETLDFNVIMSPATEDTPMVITSTENAKFWEEKVAMALAAYDPENKQYSAYLPVESSTQTVTQSLLATTAQGTQNNLSKLLQANALIYQYVNIDECIGMIATTIAANINTDIRLSYKNFDGQKKKSNILAKAKSLIEDFNRQVDVRAFIRDAITTAWLEGNYICCIRNSGTNWVLDRYPLGVAELSQYLENGRPIVQINMDKLKSALQKTMLKNKKGKALYFENQLEEIEKSFGKEIMTAYKNKDSYCRLPIENTGVVRVNNFGKLYGLSPVFRALPSALALETLRNADIALAKTKAKAIIHQKMRKECLEGDTKAKQFESLAWAHNNLMKAFKQSTVIVTTPPSIEDISYVCPKSEEVSSGKQEAYTRQILSSLGVTFLASEDVSTASAKLSFSVLMNQINAIGEQVERLLENFYMTVLRTNNIDITYVPTVRIIDSEMLDMGVRMELAQKLLGVFGASRQTAFEFVNIDIEDERSRRDKENKEGLSDVFMPYQTSYTYSDNNGTVGRPKDKDSDDMDKQEQYEMRES